MDNIPLPVIGCFVVVLPLLILLLFIYSRITKTPGPLELVKRFFSGAVEIPPGVVTVFRGKVYRTGEACRPETHAIYVPQSSGWQGFLPGITPKIFVQWSLKDDDHSILKFNHRIPPEPRLWPHHLAYTATRGSRPTLDASKCNPQTREIDYVLRCIADEFKKSAEPDLAPLQKYFGITVYTIRKEPPPPPPPPPPEGVEIAPGVYIEDRFRDKHVYLLGRSGKGKSTLMLNMARQDIASGKGVIFIDPHGDVADRLLNYIPASRVSDTVYFNPITCPIGLSTLNAESEEEKPLLLDDCMVLFQRLSDSWGPRMEAILLYTIQTLLDRPGSTFLDITRLLTDTDWRRDVVRTINQPELTRFWELDFPVYPKDAIHPILSRMAMFQLSPYIRNTLGAASGFRFYEHLQKGGIFIANISGIGEKASQLLGSILVSQIQLVVMRRARIPEEERKHSYLYVDEFHEFQSSAFGKIITGARKFKLFLTLGNQKLADLNPQTLSSIEGVETSMYFNLNPSDARHVASAVPIFEPEDFMNLADGEIIVRPARVRDSFKIKAALPPKPLHNHTAEIITRTQESYRPAEINHDRRETADYEPGPSGPPP